MFERIEPYAGDPILTLMENFGLDSRENKVNLSIGLYYDNEGNVPFLESVVLAKKNLDSRGTKPSLYLPMSGAPAYCKQVKNLLFGSDSSALHEGRISTIQTLGGSGALKIGADFLKRWFSDVTVWVSNPTWENHIAIFEGAGLAVNKYPYYDPHTGGVDFEAMIDCLRALPDRDVVLLHPCCHNPTGADLTTVQWDKVIEVVKERNLIPFLDMAYQGFGDGFTQDLYAVSAMEKSGVSFLLSNSFSKIFSLYGERTGALSVVCHSKDEAERVLGQLKATVRRSYSSPPAYGATLITEVLQNEELKSLWLKELENMRLRMKDMRQSLFNVLIQQGADERRYQFLLDQKGMFSYTGFSESQVEKLREDFGIYIVRSGRLCISGLNESNLQDVAKAILSV